MERRILEPLCGRSADRTRVFWSEVVPDGITIMRFRPANIRVINRRNSRLDRDLRCLLGKDRKKMKTNFVVDRSFYISGVDLQVRHKCFGLGPASAAEEMVWQLSHRLLRDGAKISSHYLD